MKLPFPIPQWLSFRKMFLILSSSLFILLPLLSIDAGISGDEPVHYQHAEYVFNYFKTDGADQSAINTPKTNLKYYGQGIDNLSFYINHLLNSKNPYLTRHVLNALLGALLILFSGLIAVQLSGYRAGILAMIFLLLSPRILGHSYNNLKDIPFALGYIMAIYGLIVVIRKYPLIKPGPWIWMCLGLAIAFGTRAGGLILIPIFFLFIFLRWILSQAIKDLTTWPVWKNGLAFFLLTVLACLAGCLLAIIAWPYAREAPIRHSLESLQVMTHYSISIRQLFEGQWLWSENLPAYYPIKYILITTPLLIIAGLVLQFLIWKKSKYFILILLNFAFLFPLFWIMIKASNLYGGWRHLLFVYPAIVIISACSWDALLKIQKRVLFKSLTIILLIVGLGGPLIHTIKYHPVEYVYFNKLAGGVNAAFSKYETDYYYHSLGPATRWLREYIDDNTSGENTSGKKVIIASNFPVDPYFANDENISSVYTHFFARARHDWDYGIFVNTFMGPDYLESENWPPQNSLFTVAIDGRIICAVVKRPSKLDLYGIKSYRKSDFLTSIYQLRGALTEDPKNEYAQLYLGWAYRQLQDFETSDSITRKLIQQQPMNDMAKDLVGRNYISLGKYKSALETFDAVIDQNYKYLPAYEQSAIAADSLGDYKKAASLMERGYQLGLRSRDNIEHLIYYLEKAQYHTKTQTFRTILNKK